MENSICFCITGLLYCWIMNAERAIILPDWHQPARFGIVETPAQCSEAIREMLRNGINREREAGFPQLRQVPSTHALKVLRYFGTLDAEASDAFCASLAESAVDALFPKSGSIPLYKRSEAYRRYVDATGKTAYLGYRGLRGYLAVARQGGKQLSPKTRERAEAIIPITAAELRKRVKIGLSGVIQTMKVIHEGQYWVYRGGCEDSNISVTVDYSCPQYQLEYWVTKNDARPSFWGSSFERLLGLNFAHWDCVDQRNADAAIQLLSKHIRYCVQMLSRLPE